MAEPAEHTKCGKKWVQQGNRTGHCTLCHHTFEGVALFDKHQLVLPDGFIECRDPESFEFPTGYPLKQDEHGTWSTSKKFDRGSF